MDTKRVRKDVPDHPGKDKQENRDTKKRPVTGPTAIALLSKKGSVEAENCSELNMHRAEILGAPDLGKHKTVFFGAWYKSASVYFNQRGI